MSGKLLDTYPAGSTIYALFDTFGSSGQSITLTGLAVTDVEIYKNGSTTQRASDAGIALLDTDGIDFDAITGIHGISIDLSDNTDAGFYAVGSQYTVVISSVTIDSQTVSFILGSFRIVAAEGTAGYPAVDMARISNDSTAADNLETMLDGTGGQTLSLKQLNIVNSNGSAIVATSTGGNGHGMALTGAGTGYGLMAAGAGGANAAWLNGGFDIDGAMVVSSGITGDITGNLSGSVGSVTGAVGSVTGNVGGNVTGTIGGLTQAALADFFDTDSGTDYSSAVAGSVVKEIADNAGGSSLTVGDIADAVWDEALSGHTTAGTAGKALSDAGNAGDPWSTALPGSYTSGQAGYIIGTNLDATVSSRASQTSLDTVDSNVDAILVDTAEIGAAGAGLTAIPWNASWDAEVQSECADALAAYDPPTKAELDSGLAGLNDLDAAGIRSAVGLASANLDTQLAALPTAAENADAVWDEALSGHTTAGTAGKALSDAGAAGDPWSTELPGGYGAGTAGKIIGDNLDAAVSSRASQASVNTVDSVADAIKAVTDNLPDSGALSSLATAASIAALPTAAENATAVLTTAMTESYSTKGQTKTVAQALYEIAALLGEKAVNDVTVTVKKVDGSSTAATYTLNDATAPTSITRAS